VSAPALIVLAKSPVPGRAKTRLCPPLLPAQAAALAEAALRDTLDAVAAVPVERRLLVLDGEPGAWLPAGFELAAQCAGGLGARLAGAFAAAAGPALLVGMDTPQLTPPLLERALGVMAAPAVDAVLGPAHDGGYWAIGLRSPDERVFRGVPMSSPRTCAVQRRRLRELGLSTAELEPLRDVDTIADARAVAARFPETRFAAALASLSVPYAARAAAGTA
jgi:rSAM/selenodomain-associated transferase 1